METWQLSEEVSTEQKKIGYQNLYYGFSFTVFSIILRKSPRTTRMALFSPPKIKIKSELWNLSEENKAKENDNDLAHSQQTNTPKVTARNLIYFFSTPRLSQSVWQVDRERKKTRTANYLCLQTINSSTFFGGSATLLHIAVSKVTLMFHNWLNFSERVDISAATLKLRTNSTP